MQSEAPLAPNALVGILRGVLPERVIGVAEVLYTAGIRVIEVPLNSPDPFKSIAALAGALPSDCLVGAGTVLNAQDVHRAHAAGGRLVVSPNCDAQVIDEAIRLAMQVMPGVATATEAFSAVRAGATQLKLFPASSYGPPHLRALLTVLPKDVKMFPVGGVTAEQIPGWLAAGAAGFGFGSELFLPKYSLGEIKNRAQLLVRAFQEAHRLESRAHPANTKTTTIGEIT
jgi:2-dehydro-3-deoxyphosphogalactonate aldolase